MKCAMTDIQQANEAMKVKTQWFLSSLSLEHCKAVNKLHSDYSITKNPSKYPKSVARAVLWLLEDTGPGGACVLPYR